jgi:putative ABC transport system permease protein
LKPMILTLVVTIAALLLGNSISEAVNSGYREVYTEHITGDVTISATSDRSFTVFGGEAMLVGDLLIPPVLVDSEELIQAVQRIPSVERIAGLVTVVARVEIAGKDRGQPLFGVDFSEYAALFPRFQIVRGRVPASGEPGILIHDSWFAELTEELGAEPELGTPVLLSTYPVSDSILDRVGLVDVQTARSLNGYVFGATTSGAQPEFTGDNLEDLFAVQDDLAPANQNLNRADVESRLRSADPADSRAGQTREGAWNFLLIRLVDGAKAGAVDRFAHDLREAGFDQTRQIRVRDWRQSAGGIAVLVWVIQILLNIGLIFVAAGATIVTVNTLVLSVLERSREIGTMRAGETIILVVVSGMVGTGVGVLLVGLVNALGIELTNPVLQSLFGVSRLTGRLSVSLIASHFVLSLFLGAVSVVYPLYKSLNIPPVKAMTS